MELEKFIVVFENVLTKELVQGVLTEEPIKEHVLNSVNQYIQMTEYGAFHGYDSVDYNLVKQLQPTIENDSDLIGLYNTTDDVLEVIICATKDTIHMPPSSVMIIPNCKVFNYLFKKNSDDGVIMAYYNVFKVESED